MKLSDLKQMIAEIEKHRIADNPDPDVSFWLLRPENNVLKQGEKESDHFVEFNIDTTHDVDQHRINGGGAKTSQTRQGHGDFTIPVYITHFYK